MEEEDTIVTIIVVIRYGGGDYVRKKQILDTIPDILQLFVDNHPEAKNLVENIQIVYIPSKNEGYEEVKIYSSLGILDKYDKYRSKFLRVQEVNDSYVMMVYQKIIMEENDIWDFVLYDLSYIYALKLHNRLYGELGSRCTCELIGNELYIGAELWTQFVAFYLSKKLLESAGRIFIRKTYTVFSFPKQFIGNLRYYACSASSMGYFLSVIVDDELVKNGRYLQHEYFRKFSLLHKDVRRYMRLILNYALSKTDQPFKIKQSRQQLIRLGHLFDELNYYTSEYAVEEKPFDDLEDYDIAD